MTSIFSFFQNLIFWISLTVCSFIVGVCGQLGRIWFHYKVVTLSGSRTKKHRGSYQSNQSLDRLGHRGDMRDDSAEILFQCFLQEALVSSSGMGRYVRSLAFSIRHFLCRPRRRPPSKVPRRMVLERLSWCVSFPNHTSFRLSTVSRRGPFGPTRKLVDFSCYREIGINTQLFSCRFTFFFCVCVFF